MKFYGKVKEIRTVDSGVHFALCNDLNKKEDFTICSVKTENNFGGVSLKVGEVFACIIEDYKGKFYIVKSEPKKYESKAKKSFSKKPKDDLAIRLGNAVSIATELGYELKDIPCKASGTILPNIDRLRDELTKEHPEMDAYALGARLGQSAIVVAKHSDCRNIDYTGYSKKVKILFNMITDEEIKLKQK